MTRSPASDRVPVFSLHGLTWLGMVALVAGLYLAFAVLIGVVVTLAAS